MSDSRASRSFESDLLNELVGPIRKAFLNDSFTKNRSVRFLSQQFIKPRPLSWEFTIRKEPKTREWSISLKHPKTVTRDEN